MTLRLLVADDNAATRKMVQLAFAGEDAVIEAVSSGDAALGVLEEFRPDVVLADVSMPGYSGYELCERIRQHALFADIPVIILNGAFDPHDEDLFTLVGASGWLTKPFDPSEMIDLVEKLLLDGARRTGSDLSDLPNLSDISDVSDAKAEEAVVGTETASEIAAPPFESGAYSTTSPAGGGCESYTESAAPRGFFQVTPRVLQSYLGTDCILEIFDAGAFEIKSADMKYDDARFITDEFVDLVAEKVIKKMAPDIAALIHSTFAPA